MKYICKICGYIHDGELFQNYSCPLCNAPAREFVTMVDEITDKSGDVAVSETIAVNNGELSTMAVSAICSNLSRGCEKQYMTAESELYRQLANHYKDISVDIQGSIEDIANVISQDINDNIPHAVAETVAIGNRGAQRALAWSDKVTKILSSLISRYQRNPEKFDNSNMHVCSICGFVFLGENAPDLCPICKVQQDKFLAVKEGSL